MHYRVLKGSRAVPTLQPQKETYEGKPRHSTIFISHLPQGRSSAASVGASLRPWVCITRLFGLPLPALSHTHSILISQDQEDFRFFSSQTLPTAGMPSPLGAQNVQGQATGCSRAAFHHYSVLPDRVRKSAFPGLLLPTRGLSFASLGENKAAVLLTIHSFICSFAQQVFVVYHFRYWDTAANRTEPLLSESFCSGPER